MKGTIKELNRRFAVLNKVPVERPDKDRTLIDDKISYAVKKNFKLFEDVCRPKLDVVNEKIRDHNIDLCQTEEDGTLKYEVDANGVKQFTYNKDNRKKSDANTKMLNEKYLDTVVEFTPHTVDLSESSNARLFKVLDRFDMEELDGILFDLGKYDKAQEKSEKEAAKAPAEVEA